MLALEQERDNFLNKLPSSHREDNFNQVILLSTKAKAGFISRNEKPPFYLKKLNYGGPAPDIAPRAELNFDLQHYRFTSVLNDMVVAFWDMGVREPSSFWISFEDGDNYCYKGIDGSKQMEEKVREVKQIGLERDPSNLNGGDIVEHLYRTRPVRTLWYQEPIIPDEEKFSPVFGAVEGKELHIFPYSGRYLSEYEPRVLLEAYIVHLLDRQIFEENKAKNQKAQDDFSRLQYPFKF